MVICHNKHGFLNHDITSSWWLQYWHTLVQGVISVNEDKKDIVETIIFYLSLEIVHGNYDPTVMYTLLIENSTNIH